MPSVWSNRRKYCGIFSAETLTLDQDWGCTLENWFVRTGLNWDLILGSSSAEHNLCQTSVSSSFNTLSCTHKGTCLTAWPSLKKNFSCQNNIEVWFQTFSISFVKVNICWKRSVFFNTPPVCSERLDLVRITGLFVTETLRVLVPTSSVYTISDLTNLVCTVNIFY